MRFVRHALLSIFLFNVCVSAVIPVDTQAQQIPENTYQEMRWRMIGPFRGGRTRAAAGVPGHPDVFYIGQVNGGVWKSNDYGRTWNPIFDGQPTQSIGDIAVAPSDSNVIYVGSGEGLHRPDLSVGDGIYRSSDAGKTWAHLGLRDGEQIPALAVDPHDPNRLFAAVLGHPFGPNAERGIFRSLDGGKSWEKVLYKNENTGGSDVLMDPANPSIVYAALWEAREGPWEDNNSFNGTGGGLFKSTDGGSTWRQLSKGLPQNLSQIDIAIAHSDPKRLYATVATTDKGDYASGDGLGVFRSDDAGENWYRVTTDGRPAYRIGGGDLPVIQVDPKNADVLYSASIVTMRSTDGGKTWMSLRGAPGGDDYQNLWINPDDPKTILLVSDQGAVVTVNGGETWSSWYNQPTAQLYHAATTNSFPYKVCGGQQESGSVCISSRGNDGEITFRDWHPVGVIEYGYAAPDPLDADVIYGAGRTQVSRYHLSTGQVQDVTPVPVRSEKYRGDRTEPILFSPVDPRIMFYATNVLFKSTDRGGNWQVVSPDLSREQSEIPASVGELKNAKIEKQRGAIYALAASWRDVNTLWAGTDDGWVWNTRDGGKNWNNITPPELTAWSKVTQIEASHFDDASAYVSVSGFRIDDLRPYIYRTHDGGKSWQRITNGLPEDAPVDTVREDTVRKGLLFAGTEKALWVSFDDGDHWQSLQLNLPHTSMRDLAIHENDLIVATHGRSFWILDDITPLRQVNAATAKTNALLFQPADAYRIKRSTNTDTPLPPDEPAGQNPPDGAVIDYFLAKPSAGMVTLEVLDGEGKVVRKFSSADETEVTQAELEKQLIPLYWLRPTATLAGTAGMHRWVWDLHYEAPQSTKHEYPIAAAPHDTPRVPLGATALPGSYRVRLTANGSAQTAPLKVILDPRVKTPAGDLQKQFQMEMHVGEMLSRSSVALMQARSLQEELKKLSAKGESKVSTAARELAARVDTVIAPPENLADGVEPPPTLTHVNGDAATLYGMAGAADAAPTASQISAVAALEHDFAATMKLWEQIKATDLPGLNKRLAAGRMGEIQLEENPHGGESGSDRD